MISKCADTVTDWLISCGAVEDKDKDLYRYALYSIFLSVFPLFMAIGIGLCLECVWQSVAIIIPFMLIRKFSGGYHAKHSWLCLIGSSFLLLICIGLSFQVKFDWILECVTAGAAVSLICFSPIDNENRELSEEECKGYKKIVAILVISFLLTKQIFFFCQLHTFSICISLGIILSAGLQLPCILKEFGKN